MDRFRKIGKFSAYLIALCIGMAFLPAMASSSTVSAELSGDSESSQCVVLLHGLARSSASMRKMANALVNQGFLVANISYPSTRYRVEVLSELAVSAGLEACRQSGQKQIHVVTHSMGGILVRDFLDRHTIPELSRIVMLAPPNHGSKVVDNLKGMPGFHWMNGPAIEQLGTDENSIPLKLGAMRKDTAIIAGTRSINLYLSTLLDNPDDGKVSVASARVDGMCAMLTLPVSHPFIMKNSASIAQTIHYLEEGKFTHTNAEHYDCISRQNTPEINTNG